MTSLLIIPYRGGGIYGRFSQKLSKGVINIYNLEEYTLPNEQWKAIPNYEGLYEASSFGRIRSVHKKITYTKKHGNRVWVGRILHPKHGDEKNGYRVDLWKDGNHKTFLVARLVCSAFNGLNNLTVNHKDGNRLNNHIENLEWLSLEDNIRHAFETGLMPYPKIEIIEKASNKIVFRGSKCKGSEHIGRAHTYLSSKMKKGIMENDMYLWRYVSDEV